MWLGTRTILNFFFPTHSPTKKLQYNRLECCKGGLSPCVRVAHRLIDRSIDLAAWCSSSRSSSFWILSWKIWILCWRCSSGLEFMTEQSRIPKQGGTKFLVWNGKTPRSLALSRWLVDDRLPANTPSPFQLFMKGRIHYDWVFSHKLT